MPPKTMLCPKSIDVYITNSTSYRDAVAAKNLVEQNHSQLISKVWNAIKNLIRGTDDNAQQQ
jgi:hypothetical protein